MIKENSLKNSQDQEEICRNSPSFSPITDLSHLQNETPLKTDSNQISKLKSSPIQSDPITDIKSSKAYINAMKALQAKIKKLEGKLEESKTEMEAKLIENGNSNGKLKQQLEEERRIFSNLENNLKSKLTFMEREAFELKKTIQTSENEAMEAKKQLLEENNKRDQDFKQFLKEKAEFKEKIQLQSNKLEFLETQSESLQEDLQLLRKEKLNLENKLTFLEEKCSQLEESSKEQKVFFDREKERLLSTIENLKRTHEGESEYLMREKGDLYEEVKKLKREDEELKEKLMENQRNLERNSRNGHDLREGVESYLGKSNGKSRFKYYPSVEEKNKELFSWNTPSSKKENDRSLTFMEKQTFETKQSFDNDGGGFERNQTLKNLQRSPGGIERNKTNNLDKKEAPLDKTPGGYLNLESNNNEKTSNNFAEKPPIYGEKISGNINSERIGLSYGRVGMIIEKHEEIVGKNSKTFEKNHTISEKNTMVVEKNVNNDSEKTLGNVERRLIFKNSGVEKEKGTKLSEKNDDLKENLRQILKNENFSGNKMLKPVDKSQEDSDYDKNISELIELERDLLELNKVYHDLTEQILVNLKQKMYL